MRSTQNLKHFQTFWGRRIGGARRSCRGSDSLNASLRES